LNLSRAQIENLLEESERNPCDPDDECCVELVAIANLPSGFGKYQICGLVSPCDGKEHTAVIKGDIVDKEDVLVRLHSECLTGDVLGSKRCDCRAQLHESLRMIEEEGQGVLLYLRQEGRNIGLTEKLKAYALQDKGYDTIDANLLLGHGADERDYGVAAYIFETLHVKSIRLLTNNPEKVKQLVSYGVEITERVPLIIEPDEYNRIYLETKKQKSGHMLGRHKDTKSVENVLELADESAG
jgi:GTP cyclohydrolase II